MHALVALTWAVAAAAADAPRAVENFEVFSKSGIVGSSAQKTLTLRKFAGGSEVAKIKIGGFGAGIAISPDGRFVAGSSYSGSSPAGGGIYNPDADYQRTLAQRRRDIDSSNRKMIEQKLWDMNRRR